jgi:hypothetical protein
MKKSALNHARIIKPVLYFLPVFMLLCHCALPAFARGGGKSEEINATYRNLAEKMKEYYEGGELRQVIDLYNKECCEPGAGLEKWEPGKEKGEFKKVKKEIRAEFYQFLALSLIALNRPELGETYVRKMLVLRRDEGTDKYWLAVREMARYRYYVAPRFLVGVNLGTNFTFVRPGQRYMVLEPASETGREAYQKKYAFSFSHSRAMQAGLIIEYALDKNISIAIQPSISTQKFQYKNTFIRTDETGATDPATLDYTHNHTLGYLEIPLLLKYRLIKPKFKPYIQAGVYYSMLRSAIKSLHAESRDKEYKEDAIVDIKQLLNRTNLGIWVGAGIESNIGGFRLQIETNYKFGFKNIVDTANRFTNQQLMYAFYDVFDDMKLRNWELTLKVLLPISFKAFRR